MIGTIKNGPNGILCVHRLFCLNNLLQNGIRMGLNKIRMNFLTKTHTFSNRTQTIDDAVCPIVAHLYSHIVIAYDDKWFSAQAYFSKRNQRERNAAFLVMRYLQRSFFSNSFLLYQNVTAIWLKSFSLEKKNPNFGYRNSHSNLSNLFKCDRNFK